VRRYGDEIERQIDQATPPDGLGWIELTFTFETREEACSHILSFGSLAEVLQPHDLRKKIAQIATTLLTFYSEGKD
jgi:predicted DNA-binding transcriptional regulator YafY